MKTTRPTRPLFYADWDDVLMIHLEVDPVALQKHVPFPLDLWEGKAYVGLVAFTMRGMRLAYGGRWTAFLTAPLATHPFLNVRTYVEVDGEKGIHFLAEWLPNRLSVWLGPSTYGLPYRRGRLAYRHHPEGGAGQGRVEDHRSGDCLIYQTDPDPAPILLAPAAPGGAVHFLWERYRAFHRRGRHLRCFAVEHQPWAMSPLPISLEETNLLVRRWPLFAEARVAFSHHSPGLRKVTMGVPSRRRLAA